MTIGLPAVRLAFASKTVIALAVAASAGSAFAGPLPPFTFNPGAVALAGATFSADNILISDFSTVTLSGTTFTDTGFLSVSAFQLGGATFTPAGLNSTYGMYIAFSGSGTTTPGNPATTPTFGSFTTLTYTLYGFNGTAVFGFSGNTPTETATGEIVLATGSLINGSVITSPNGDGTFTPSANAKTSFNVDPGALAFFQAPVPFYNVALTAFTNTASEVEPFAGGFRIRQGGGSINFVSTVPEPSSYAMLLAGLGAIGFIARRRKG
jgi:hypothetical protein